MDLTLALPIRRSPTASRRRGAAMEPHPALAGMDRPHARQTAAVDAPATPGEAVHSWRDASVLMNAATVALVACLVPAQPFSPAQLHLTLAIWAFVTVAFVNHLAPRRWPWLTHVVKAAYTQLLFASVAPAAGLDGRWRLAALAVSLVDLAPLATGGRAARVAEAAGATVRLCAVAWGFWLLRFPAWLVVTYLACSAGYFVERRRRIARGQRSSYGWLHCVEHVAVWLFLYTLDAPRLDVALVWGLLGGVLGAGAASLTVLGFVTNLRLYRALERDLPAWFDPALRDRIEQKALANLRSVSLQHYFMKPFSPKIRNLRVSWSDIEEMIARVDVPAAFDCVVGVGSGGAFIARRVAAGIGVSKVRYLRSRLWSRSSFFRTTIVSLRYYLGLSNAVESRFDDAATDLRGARVLLVDDSVCTGASLASAEALCRRRGAVHVETFALFASPAHPTDHHGQLSRTPLVWPWGWESD